MNYEFPTVITLNDEKQNVTIRVWYDLHLSKIESENSDTVKVDIEVKDIFIVLEDIKSDFIIGSSPIIKLIQLGSSTDTTKSDGELYQRSEGAE